VSKRLPPNVGLDCNKPYLFHPYAEEMLKAARMRFAPCCGKIGFTGSDGIFRCPACGKEFAPRDCPRVYRRIGGFAGRRGGKSIGGSRIALNEILAPNGVGWVSGPTEKILHDATMPALLRRIPRDWCANWDAEHMELTLVNGHLIMFRSLHDPDRGHCGVGVDWAWFDEAAFIEELAWDYFRPALTDFGGVAVFTSSVDGFDWTYDRVEKPALVDQKPGFFAAKWRTIDNPYIATFRADEVEEAKASMPPQLFRQEYEGERENFTGSVYGEYIDEAWLGSDDEVKDYIPEWPMLDPSRRIIIGLDSGADHPFGGVALVSTEKGMVAVREYLQRLRAFGAHLGEIQSFFPVTPNTLWSANRNEAQLRIEFAAHNVLVAPAENDQMAGIQRVMSWLYTKQFKIAYTCPKLFEQMKKYRYAENVMKDGSKRAEKVYKKEDELPDCVRYAFMTWPSLPKALAPMTGRDLRGMDARTRFEIQEMARKMAVSDGGRDLTPADKEYPIGNMYESSDEDIYGTGLDAFYN
jgi:hypothetical protein